MEKVRFGIVGCGNMGSAIATAICKTIEPWKVTVANRTQKKAELLAAELGCQVGDNAEAAMCDFVFLCVKPYLMRDMLSGISQVFAQREKEFVLVTMAAGLTIAQIREMAVVTSDYHLRQCCTLFSAMGYYTAAQLGGVPVRVTGNAVNYTGTVVNDLRTQARGICAITGIPYEKVPDSVPELTP